MTFIFFFSFFKYFFHFFSSSFFKTFSFLDFFIHVYSWQRTLELKIKSGGKKLNRCTKTFYSVKLLLFCKKKTKTKKHPDGIWSSGTDSMLDVYKKIVHKSKLENNLTCDRKVYTQGKNIWKWQQCLQFCSHSYHCTLFFHSVDFPWPIQCYFH